MSQTQEQTFREYDQMVNSSATDKLVRKLDSGHYSTSMLTYFDNKIYAGDVPDSHNMLVKDVNLFHQRRVLGASGEVDKAARITPKHIFTEDYLAMRENASAIQEQLHENPWNQRSILGAAGPTSTDYEVVRRVNYLTGVKGPQHQLARYNAINAINVQQSADLNVKGFARTAKLIGLKEIGDEVIPDLAKNAYTSYEKFLYADSFRYEFSMREIKDSQFPLEQQVTQDLPGIFAKLKDDKIIALMNAISDTTPTTDWDALLATYETHYTSDAAADIDTQSDALADYGYATQIIFPIAVARAYLNNIRGTAGARVTDGIATTRDFALPGNPGITAHINEGITAGTAVILSKEWATLFQGPTVQVTYKNVMTPGQIEGNILFDFNGVAVQVAAGAKQIVGLLT